MLRQYLLFMLIVFLFYSCGLKKETVITELPTLDSIQKLVKEEYRIDRSKIRHIIISENDSNGHSLLIKNSLLFAYYNSESNPFLWIKDEHSHIDTLLYYIRNVHEHAIDPALFPVSEIDSNLVRLKRLDFKENETINHLLANIEYTLTKTYLNYVCMINFGCIDPHKILNNLEDEEKVGGRIPKLPDGTNKKKIFYDIPLKRFNGEFITHAMASVYEGLNSFLDSIQPKDTFYLRLQKEYLKVDSLAVADNIPKIPELGKNILLKEGDKHKITPILARRLISSRHLSEAYLPADSTEITSQLLDAMNAFRIKNGISKNTSIGDYSIRLLNRPADYYKNCIKLNMERLRWKPQRNKGHKYVMANIPAYMLQAIDQTSDSILEMRICCGTVKNKTPILSSAISYMDLNPYWNVPKSIIRKEIIPAYKRDTAYFTKNRMKVYDTKGKQLNPHDINWSKYSGNVPFDVKQDNKQGNSLGRLIFRFPNTHAVYLHDTPSRWAFMKDNRAVSHGCVRIEKPLDFSFFLLKEKDELLMDRIRLAIDLNPVTEEGKQYARKTDYKEMKQHRFKESVPVFLDYYTMYLNKNGELIYCEDIYKYDEPLLQEMNNVLYGTKELRKK